MKALLAGSFTLSHGIAGDDPAGRRLLAQRVEIFRLAGQHRDDAAALEQAARVALADEIGQVGAEGDVEDGVRLGCGQRRNGRAGIDLAQRRPLLADELDVRPLGAPAAA